MEIELHNNKLKVFEDGKVLVLGRYKPNKGEYYEKKYFLRNCYKCLDLFFEGKHKKYQVHRLVAFAFLGLDIENHKQVIDHKNRDKLDNRVSNLRIVSHQENLWNTNAKGFYKNRNKYHARIFLNGKHIYLGSFETKEEASNSYKQAKLIHHIIK